MGVHQTTCSVVVKNDAQISAQYSPPRHNSYTLFNPYPGLTTAEINNSTKYPETKKSRTRKENTQSPIKPTKPVLLPLNNAYAIAIEIYSQHHSTKLIQQLQNSPHLTPYQAK